jgi:hypothetical protein
VTYRAAALATCLLLLMTGCSGDGGNDQQGQQATAEPADSSPADSQAEAATSGDIGVPGAEGAGSASTGATGPDGPADGESAGAASGSAIGTDRPGASPTAPAVASPSQLPDYTAEDFYHWHWSPEIRSALSWSFTSTVPPAWRAPISTAATSWNAERRSLQYAGTDGDQPAYPPPGCNSAQLDTNGVHRVSLDGSDGIVATTYSCVNASSAEAVSIQVAIDSDDRWFTGAAPSAPGEYDLIGAAAHEFGHATGWEGHYASDDWRCTDAARAERMCPQLSPESTSWRLLGLTDRRIFDGAY